MWRSILYPECFTFWFKGDAWQKFIFYDKLFYRVGIKLQRMYFSFFFFPIAKGERFDLLMESILIRKCSISKYNGQKWKVLLHFFKLTLEGEFKKIHVYISCILKGSKTNNNLILKVLSACAWILFLLYWKKKPFCKRWIFRHIYDGITIF